MAMVDHYQHLMSEYGHTLYPIDPNPAIYAHAVFYQSGHIFSKIEPYKEYELFIMSNIPN